MTDTTGLSYYELVLDSRDATSTYDAAYSSLVELMKLTKLGLSVL
jgi:hypothetical protein